MKKIYASQVEIGMCLPCDVYDETGVLLWSAGSVLSKEKQIQRIIKNGYRTDFQEWIPPNIASKVDESRVIEAVRLKKVFVYPTVLDALLEVQLPLNHIFDVFKADSFLKDKRNLTAQIASIVDIILDVCRNHVNEAIATIHMFHQGKYTVLNAIYTSITASLICQTLKLPEEQNRSITSAALTANGSIVKLMEATINQPGGMSNEQKDEFHKHPSDTLMLLTRAGIRDDEWLDAVYMHHEAVDGSGFPRNLRKDEISLGGRILAVAETYVSLVLPKQMMKQALDPPAAIKRLYKLGSKHMDKEILAAFIKLFGLIPPGTFANLKEGGIGIVLEKFENNSKPIHVAKVADSITNFNSNISISIRHKITEIIHPPSNIPKRLFKLWSMLKNKLAEN